MKKICPLSGREFIISEADKDFYRAIGVPLPTLYPKERRRRRLTWRNESNLYWRKCDGTGKEILSIFSPDKPYTVYDVPYWFSDQWDPMQYGREFDFNKSFFDQYDDLLKSVPQVARAAWGNCDAAYTNQSQQNQAGYMLFGADHTKDCLYNWHISDSKNCIDCDYADECVDCYNCLYCLKCCDSYFLYNCHDCKDSWFLKNCKDCQHCFGSINLEGKQFYFKNEACTEVEYRKRLAALELHTNKGLKKAALEVEKDFESCPHQHCSGFDFKTSSGDYLYNTRNCLNCYSLTDSQDSRFVTEARNIRNTYDMDGFGARRGASWCYEVHEIGGNVTHTLFSDQIWNNCHHITYSKLCMNDCSNLFACVGLRNKSKCIFNKSYTQHEYETLKTKIINHMKSSGEWGEYFPAGISPFGYNETAAYDSYPLVASEAKNLGAKWFHGSADQVYAGPKYSSVPRGNIDISGKILTCQATGENYQVLAREYEFYKKHRLPIPNLCPLERHRMRDDMKNRRHLYDRYCEACHMHLKTTYGDSRREKILCQDCYSKVIN